MINVSIVRRINDILVEEFEIDNEIIEPLAPLKTTLDLDSLDYVDLVVLIESNFAVKLTEQDFSAMLTFQDFYDAVERKMKEKS